MYIYFIINKLNGKYYVGQTTKSIERRWKGHLQNVKHRKSPLNAAIKKYGASNFEVRFLFKCQTQEQLDDAEKYFISHFDSTNRNIGYNLSPGGSGGKGFGDKLSESTKIKIGLANKGLKRSPELIQRFKESRKGRIPTNLEKLHSGNKGSKRTSEQRQKMSQAMKGKKKKPISSEALKRRSESIKKWWEKRKKLLKDTQQ